MRNIISILLLLFLLLLAGGSGHVLAERSGGYDTGLNITSATQTLTASTQIICTGGRLITPVAGSGGAVDLTVNPQIAPGIDGQLCIIAGTHATNTVKLDNGTGLLLRKSYTLSSTSGVLLLRYSSTSSLWEQIELADAVSVQGKAWCDTPSPTDGQVVTWSDANQCYEPQTSAASQITVQKDGSDIGTRAKVNLITGQNQTLTVADNGVQGRVDVTIDPGVNSRKRIHYREEFICGNNNNNTSIGCLGQSTANSGGTVDDYTSEANHPGIMPLSTGAISGQRGGVRLTATSDNALLFDYNYDVMFFVKTGADVTTVSYRCGIFEPNTAGPGAAALIFEYDTVDGHTQWHAINRASNIETGSDTAMSGSIAADTWYVFRIVKSGTTVTYSSCSGDDCTLTQIASYANVNVPAAGTATNLGCHVITNAAADRKLFVDAEDIIIDFSR